MDTAAQEKTAKGLQNAVRAEIEGHFFYLMAAKATSDQKGREVFERLAGEELEHSKFLQAQYLSISARGSVDATVKLGSPFSLSGASPIFSEKLLARAQDAHFEMTALSVAIQLELNASKYYGVQAAEAPDPEVRKFYAQLADGENGHMQALLAQQQALQEDYWSKNSFSPF